MSSIKCANCRLVNFSTETHCKRCQQPLNEFTNIAAQRPYQANSQQAAAYQNPYQPYQTPPPPPAFDAFGREILPQADTQMLCVKCGSRESVQIQNFKKEYVPPIAYIGAFIGIIPMLILILCLKVRHKLTAPFCTDCWSRFGRSATFSTASSVGFVLGVPLSFIVLLTFESWFGFLFVLALTFGFVICAAIYKHLNSPKYKKVDRRQVIIEAPLVGEIRYANN